MSGLRVAVLGGGMGGVVAAAELSRLPGVSVVLYERSMELGGLQRSVTIDDAVFDIGPFLFCDDHEMFTVFPWLFERFVAARPPHRSITPSGRLDRYPSTPGGYFRDHGLVGVARAAASLLSAKVRHRRRDTLPSLVRYYLGDEIHERSGFRTYIEKLYGLPEDEIDLEFAATRLAFLEDVCSLRRRARRLVSGAFSGAPAQPHEPAIYLRPPGGFASVYDAIGDELERAGVELRLGARLERIRRDDDGSFLLEDASGTERFDRVVSTVPITTAAALIGMPMTRGLEYMQLVSLFYRFRGQTGHDAAVLCNLSRRGKWKRLTSFASMYGHDSGEDWFTVEVTARDPDAEAVATADADFRAHMASLGHYRGDLRLVGSHVSEHAYPVYRVRDAELLRDTRAALERWGLDLLGRQGRFDYVASGLVAQRAGALAAEVGAAAGAPGQPGSG